MKANHGQGIRPVVQVCITKFSQLGWQASHTAYLNVSFELPKCDFKEFIVC